MSLLVVGLNHKSAAVSLRERAGFTKDEIPNALAKLLDKAGVKEAVIVSTCNRMEIYVWQESEDFEALLEFLSENKKISPQELEEHFFRYRDMAAARHLFEVCSSLDSMLIGEPEIMGQVKRAYQQAQDVGSTQKMLNWLFQKSFSVGKRVRTETGLGTRPVSLGSVACSLVLQIFGGQEVSVLMLGAGEIAENTLEHLMAEKGRCRLMVCNRSLANAQKLVDKFGGEAAGLEDLGSRLLLADVVVASVGVENWIISKEMLEKMGSLRGGRPLFFVDLGVPRNIEPAVAELEGVYCFDMDDLQKNVEDNYRYRESMIVECRPYIEEGVREFDDWNQSLARQAVVAEIKRSSEQLILNEFERNLKYLGELDDKQREAVLFLCRRVVNKVLHHPVRSLSTGKKPDDSHQWKRFFLGE